jgi:hypothetical protein
MSAFLKHRSKGKRSRIDYALPFSPSPLKKPKSRVRPFGLKTFTPSYSYARYLADAMGNILSSILRRNKASTSHDSSEKISGFEHYKSLVGDTSRPDARLVTRKGLDAKSIVERVSFYKSLYEETRLRDARLGSLEVEVKLTEEKLLGLRKETHIIEVEEEDEVTILSFL